MIEVASILHLDRLEMRPKDFERLAKDPKGYQKIQSLIVGSTAGALIKDDVVWGVFGFYEMWPRVLGVWAYPSKHVAENPMIYLRTVRRFLQAIEKSHKPIRMHTEALDDELHTKWMQFLGFQNETPNGMKNFSILGETFNMWSRVFEENNDGAKSSDDERGDRVPGIVVGN